MTSSSQIGTMEYACGLTELYTDEEINKMREEFVLRRFDEKDSRAPASLLQAIRDVRKNAGPPSLILAEGSAMNALLGSTRFIDGYIYQAEIDSNTKTAKVRCLG